MDSKTVALGVVAGLSGCLSVGALVLASTGAETVNRLRKEVDYLMAQSDVLVLRNDLVVSELAVYKEYVKALQEAEAQPAREAEDAGKEAAVMVSAETEAETERRMAEAEIEAATRQAAEAARRKADAAIEAAVRAADEKRARFLGEREAGRLAGQDLDN